MTISSEKQQIKEILVEISGLIGELIGSLIANAIFAGLLYAILHYLIGIISVTYWQVFGIILILDFIKNFLKK